MPPAPDDSGYEYEEATAPEAGAPLESAPAAIPPLSPPRPAGAAPIRPQPRRRPPVAVPATPPQRAGRYALAGALGALILAGFGLALLLTRPSPNPARLAGGLPPGVGTAGPVAVQTGSSASLPPPVATQGSGTPVPPADAPPRMSLADFKRLYDDPARRPLIIDVRAAETYAAGHIAGAVSRPEADLTTWVKDLPKDRLVVAYCQ